jgi:NADPH:quinone reductase-like Zn-dependent oxidoreductase
MKTFSWQFDAYGDPGKNLQWREQELDEPGPGQALVKIKAVGMNRSEFNYARGNYIPARQFPSAIGQELVGEIIALGAAASSGPQVYRNTPLRVGATVAVVPGRIDMCSMGSYRQCGLYEQAALVPIPDNYSPEEGAAYWMAILTAGGCLQQAGISPDTAKGKRILVTAASSGIGIMALKLARAWGATTIATTRSLAKTAQLKQLADHVVLCSDSNSLIAGVNNAIGDLGVNVSLDPVGEAFYPGLIAVSANGGIIVSYEMITGREPLLPIAMVMIKDLTIRGFTLFRVYQQPGLFEQLIDIGLEYSEQARPVIAAIHPMSEAPAALEQLGSCEHLGKLVLVNT